MRRLLIILVSVLLAGSLLAWLVEQETGYILIFLGSTTIEMNLWGAGLVVAGLWFVFYLLKQVLWKLRGLGKLREKRQRRLQVQTARGLILYMEGRWSQARELLEKSAQKAQIPTLNYLAAANSAYEEGDYTSVARLLDNAELQADGDELAVGITRARLSLRSGHYQQALDELRPLYYKMPNHYYIFRLQQQAYRGLKDWDSLERLLPKLKHNNFYSKGEVVAVQTEVYTELLKGLATKSASSSTGAKINLWNDIPKKIKKSPQVIEAYTRYLISQNDIEQAEMFLRKAINRCWNDNLVDCYGDIACGDGFAQVATAEGWLMAHPENVSLLNCLGRLTRRAKLWGKARGYMEAELQRNDNLKLYVELAQLMEQLGDPAKSAEYYRRGLIASVNASVAG